MYKSNTVLIAKWSYPPKLVADMHVVGAHFEKQDNKDGEYELVKHTLCDRKKPKRHRFENQGIRSTDCQTRKQ